MIVALADVKETLEASPRKLWEISKSHGGGLKKSELITYFESKNTGYAIILQNIRSYANPVTPSHILKSFSAPQSFRYLTAKELRKLENLLALETKK